MPLPSALLAGFRPRAKVVLLCCWALLCGFGCNAPAGGGGQDEGPGHRAQRLGLTPEQEYKLGEEAYQQVLKESQVVRGGPDVQRVRAVGSRIADAVMKNEALQREINLHLSGYKFDWQYTLLEDKQVNAFCLPGGKVAVFTGLMQLVHGKDDWLATVLGHEIAHALAHHGSERIAREQMREQAVRVIGGTIGAIDPRDQQKLIGLLGAGAKFYDLKYDRQQESEADHIGLFLMTFAGYDPRQAVAFWEEMAKVGAHRPEVLSDHPSDAHRIAAIKGWVPPALAAKKASDEGRIAPPPGGRGR